MEKQELQKLIEEGISSHAIAKKIGKAQTTVRYWVRKYGLKLHKHRVFYNGNNKVCTKCLIEKDLKDFYKKRNGLYHTYCKICLNSTAMNRQQNLKKLSVDYKGGKCKHCGYNKCIGALQFHHIDPTKKDFNISKKNKCFENLKKELDKCVLLCSNCHVEEHDRLRK